MRRRDPQAREDGFQLLLPAAAEHLDELMTAFADETHDHGLRCWLLELIGEARSPQALSLLESQLHGQDHALRMWAVSGLKQLDTKQARRALWSWSQNSPELAADDS